MDLQRALQSLKQQVFSPVYLLVGTEKRLMERFEEALMATYLGDDANEMNHLAFDMENTPVQSAVIEANSFSFFSERKIVRIKDAYFLTGAKKKTRVDHDIDQLADYFNHPAPDVVVVIEVPYEKLDKRKKIIKKLSDNVTTIDVSEMQGPAVKTYVEQTITQAGVDISPATLQYFLERVNYELSPALNELEKLLLFIGDSSEITQHDVEILVTPTLDDDVFHLTDYIMTGQVEQAIQLYRELLGHNEQPIGILALIQSNFRLYTQIVQLKRLGYNQGSMAKELGVHPYRIKMTAKQMAAYSANRLMRGYMQLVELEHEMKTGKVDQKQGLEWFILQFCAREA